MKKYLSFIGVILLLPILIAISVIFTVEIDYTYMGLYSSTIGCIIMSIIFYKQIKLKQFYKNINLLSTILTAIIITIILKFISITIGYHNYDLSKIITKRTIFSIDYYIFAIILVPIFEELSSRIIIINKFNGKINNWILIFTTSALFGILHYGTIKHVISTFIFGLVISYIFIKTKNALLIILVHFFNNSIAKFSYYLYELKYFYISVAHYFYINIIIFTILAILVFWVYRKQFDNWLIKTTKTKEIEI